MTCIPHDPYLKNLYETELSFKSKIIDLFPLRVGRLHYVSLCVVLNWQE
jgi:hypothetical protein